MEWSLLSDKEMEFARENLGYSRKTWNDPSTATIEKWSYHDLHDDEIAGVEGLSMTDEAWDCHVNHYFGYWWEDVEYYGYSEYFVALGWDAESWDGDATPPDTEDLYWEELTARQRAAATQLCYFKDLWDVISIPDWEI